MPPLMPPAPSMTDKVEVLRVGPIVSDVDVVQVQLAQRAGPFGALPRGVEHHRRPVDRHDGGAEALDDPQREFGPPAAQVEDARRFVERQQVEQPLDLGRRDRDCNSRDRGGRWH